MKLTKISTNFLFLIGFLVSSSFASEEKNKAAEIQWMTLEQAYAASQKSPKKIIIDVYTDWCGWCKVMDKKTFTNLAVVEYINENYYAVKLNAESKEPIKIGDTTYTYDPQQNANRAAVALLQGKMSFPSIVYLDEKFNMIQPLPGYMEARAFHEVITFIGGDHFRAESFEAYRSGTYKQIFEKAITSF